jgi:hypothetical protein
MLFIYLETHPLKFDVDGFAVVEGEGPDAAWDLWVLVLLMAVRDKARSVHYHSWLGEDALSYVCPDGWHTMMPPKPPLATQMVQVWLDRLSRKPKWWPFHRRHQQGTGVVHIGDDQWSIGWYVSCWSRDGVEGVDLIRQNPESVDHP